MMTTHADSRRLGFLAASLALIATFAASAAPIPLYGVYRAAEGLSYTDLSLTAVAYFAGAVTALLVFGRLSNHLGRRPVVLLSLGLAGLASLVLLRVSGAAPLILGRILLGLACGLASSATAAFAQDNAPIDRAWMAPALVSTGPMLGLTLGALSSGFLVDASPWPRILPYVLVLVGLACSAALVAASHETVPLRSGVLASLRPRFALPVASRRLFPVAACTFVATWALGGFYQAFGPAMATDQLGSSSALIAALVFSSMMAPSALGGPLAAKRSPAFGQRVGMVAFALAVMGVILSLRAHAVVPFLLASAAAGVAQGVTLTGSIRGLLAHAALEERAGAFAVIFATSYTGAAIPSFLAGQASHWLGLQQVAIGYGGLAALSAIITLLAARDPPPAKPVARS